MFYVVSNPCRYSARVNLTFGGGIITSMDRQYVLLEGPLPSEGLFTLGTGENFAGRVNLSGVPGQGVFGGKGEVTFLAMTLLILPMDGGSVVLQPRTRKALPAIRTWLPLLGVHVGDVDLKAVLVGQLLIALGTDN